LQSGYPVGLIPPASRKEPIHSKRSADFRAANAVDARDILAPDGDPR
jgi:hypothetical protein